MSGKTRTRSTAKQLKLLVDYMSTHPKLARGEFSGPQGRLFETRQWEKLRAMLSEYGPDKSVDQWKVSWRDVRRKARQNGNSVNRASRATDIVVEIPALSDMNKKVLGVIDTKGALGIQGGEESGTTEQDFSQTVAGSSQQQHRQRMQRQQRQRQLERERANQFLEAELESNNYLRDIADQLAIANIHSAIRARSAFKEKLWRLRRDLFK